MRPTNIEEGWPQAGPNPSPAGAEDTMHAYYARKRSVCVSTLLLLLPIAALVAARAPIVGLDLLIGGVCGIAYALLVMHANERLASPRSALGAHARNSVLRVLAFGAVPVLTAMIGPVWGMGLYFAGFFSPLVLYASAVRSEIARES